MFSKEDELRRQVITLSFGIAAPVIVYVSLVVLNNAFVAFGTLYIGLYVFTSVLDLFVFGNHKKGELIQSLGLYLSCRSIKIGILSGLFFGAVVFVFFSLLRTTIFKDEVLIAILSEWNITKREVLPIMIILVLINPLFEEFYWRSYFLRRLKISFSIHVAILISSFFYASYHFITTGFLFSFRIGLLLTAGVFAVGVVWGYMRVQTESFIPSAISHLLADAGIVLAFLLYIVPVLG